MMSNRSPDVSDRSIDAAVNRPEIPKNRWGKGPLDQAIVDRLLENRRFLAAVDAYRLGLCTMGQMNVMALKGPPYIPIGAHFSQYADFVLDTADRIIAGTITVPAEDKEKFAHFYAPKETPPE